ncbi:zinc finger domain-containing protein [Streptomyces sp. NRRL F-5630]|uniref:zinc finger domain-containing protein n=1 Tax=Streptomyces sp. NRRL F-5630 TaxID=1463864 RepID=UPI003EBCB168
MPASLRDGLRAPRHPARAVRCPHCHASPGAPCQLRRTSKPLTDSKLHPVRITVWARDVANCPQCGARRGEPCISGGHRMHDSVHHPREQTAAANAEREAAEKARAEAARPDAELRRLRAAMADAHPDRGGTDEQFIAARTAYENARRSS